ncbi:hypothetical protein ACFXKF_36190 [Streptomyces scopuliridis]
MTAKFTHIPWPASDRDPSVQRRPTTPDGEEQQPDPDAPPAATAAPAAAR